MRLSAPISAVIFDLDGVLLDTETLYSEAASTILARYGKEYPFEVKAQTMGRDARFGAELLIDTLGLPLTASEYLAERADLLKVLFERSRALPGAVGWVNALNRAGLPLAIATSSSRELCVIKFKGKPWINQFQTILFGDDPRIKELKPAPDIFLLAAEELGVPAEECLVFEDSPAGVAGAVAAGMQVIALPDPRHDLSKFQNATRVIKGYGELSLGDLGLQP